MGKNNSSNQNIPQPHHNPQVYIILEFPFLFQNLHVN